MQVPLLLSLWCLRGPASSLGGCWFGDRWGPAAGTPREAGVASDLLGASHQPPMGLQGKDHAEHPFPERTSTQGCCSAPLPAAPQTLSPLWAHGEGAASSQFFLSADPESSAWFASSVTAAVHGDQACGF